MQEATGEIVDLAFHPEERFGSPASSNIRPSDNHDCWKQGWVRCDRLPIHIAVRWDDSAEDYTGLGKPGVWHLKPTEDKWDLPIDTVMTIDHPGAPRPKVVKMTAKKHSEVKVLRCQVPVTHEDDMTYQNAQGKTVRGPEGQAKGFVVDLFKRPSMLDPEYFQHVYMIMGRARKLDWMLLQNFPSTPDGEPDWTVFENGPPAYLCEFLEVLGQRARETMPRLLCCQRELNMPAWEKIKPCSPDPASPGRYLYEPADWGFRRRADQQCAHPRPAAVAKQHKKPREKASARVKRRRGPRVSQSPPQQQQEADAAAGLPPPEPQLSPFMRACGHLEPAVEPIIRKRKRR